MQINVASKEDLDSTAINTLNSYIYIVLNVGEIYYCSGRTHIYKYICTKFLFLTENIYIQNLEAHGFESACIVNLIQYLSDVNLIIYRERFL